MVTEIGHPTCSGIVPSAGMYNRQSCVLLGKACRAVDKDNASDKSSSIEFAIDHINVAARHLSRRLFCLLTIGRWDRYLDIPLHVYVRASRAQHCAVRVPIMIVDENTAMLILRRMVKTNFSQMDDLIDDVPL